MRRRHDPHVFCLAGHVARRELQRPLRLHRWQRDLHRGDLRSRHLYTAKWGAPIVGKKYFVKVVQEQLGMQDNGTLFTAIST